MKCLRKGNRPEGSLTVECALVLPLFMFFILSVIYMTALFRTESVTETGMMQNAQRLARDAYVGEALGVDETLGKLTGALTGNKDQVVLIKPGSYHVPFNIFGLTDFNYLLRVSARKWTGYDILEESHDEEIVYITETGTVYHKSPNCTHIDLDIHAVSGASYRNLRNKGGCRYYPCERCMRKKKVPSVVYVSSWGTSAHASKDCSGLKRSVRAVPISEAGGRAACSRCGMTK